MQALRYPHCISVTALSGLSVHTNNRTLDKRLDQSVLGYLDFVMRYVLCGRRRIGYFPGDLMPEVSILHEK